MSSLCLQLSTFNGRIWCRLSGNVYSKKEDFVRAKDVLVEVFKVQE